MRLIKLLFKTFTTITGSYDCGKSVNKNTFSVSNNRIANGFFLMVKVDNLTNVSIGDDRDRVWTLMCVTDV